MKKPYFILVMLVFLSFSSTVFGQTLEEFKRRNKTLESDLSTAKEIIGDLTYKIKELKLYSKSLSDITAIVTLPITPARNYKKEYEEQLSLNSTLNTRNKVLKKKQSELNAEIARLKRLLGIEVRKVENLEYEKQQLEITIARMEVKIDTLQTIKRELTQTNQKLDRHIGKLQIDSTKKEVKIIEQADEIIDLTAAKNRLLENRTVLIGLAKKQKQQLNEVKNKHKVDKLQLVSSYIGINYNLTAFNNPIISNNDEELDRGISNLSLSWYNSFLGGYFSIPYNYCSNNPFANCPDDNIDTYFSIRDIESVKMAMDIKGIGYQDLKFAYTENHFKTYSAGLHFAPMRYIYVSVGTSILKGSSWDLYEGDLTGFESIVTENDVMPIKNEDGYYTLNYQNHSIIKPTAGLAFIVPFRGVNSKRSTNDQIRSKVLSSYNYKSGFQLEVGYDWLFNDFYAKAGLHFKLWNYDQDILDKKDYYNLAPNEIRRGLKIIIEENGKQDKIDERKINRGMKIIIEALVGRSAYFQSEADYFVIQGKFAQADTSQQRSDDLARLACCLTEKFLNEKDEKNGELTCNGCPKEDLNLLYEFLPDDEGVKIGGSKNRETAILKNTKEFFDKRY